MKPAIEFEAELSKWFCNQLKRECHVQRIETNINPGVPDLSLCRDGVAIWVELKMFIEGKVLLRKEQYAWGLSRSLHGDRVFVVACHEDWIHVWRFPDVQVSPYGNSEKYVRITNSWEARFDRKLNVDDLKNMLFTCTK